MEETIDFFNQSTFQTAITDHQVSPLLGDSNGFSLKTSQSLAEPRLTFNSSSIIEGTSNNDILRGDNSNNTIFGFNGQDELFGGSGDDSLDGGDGDDKLLGQDGNDILVGGSGQDELQGGLGDDSLDGGDGDDKLFGQEGSDALFGGQGQDQLNGGVGNDFLNGGSGDNTLTGGADSDTFVVSRAGKNRITDFEDGVDTLVLEGGLTFDQIRIFEQNSETWITTQDNQPLAFLTGINPSQITETDFLNARDSAGNTANEANAIIPTTPGRGVRGYIDTADDDYYAFILGATNQFNLSLDGLAADVNVELLDSNENAIASSTNPDRTPESISTTLETGTYFIRITSATEVGTPYNLELSVTPLIEGVTTEDSDEVDFLQTDVSSQLINLDDFRTGSLAFGSNPRFGGIDGSGFSVVVIDTGINLTHPYFGPDTNGNGVADRIVFHQDFTNTLPATSPNFPDVDGDGVADATDNNGHGTNVSSIVAANDNSAGDGGNFTGMAPGANIIHLQVFPDSGGGAPRATQQQALQWILGSDNGVRRIDRFNIASVNLSLGSGNFNTSTTTILSDEFQALANAGVVVVAASGNNYGNLNAQGIATPSADPNVLSIGAVYDTNVGSNIGYDGNNDTVIDAIANTTAADRIAPFSQRDQTLTTVFAPGAQITGAGLNDTPGTPGFTSTFSGTSQAAPHVAGMAVLAQQLAVQELDRRLTPTEFRNFLRETGVTINDGDDENDNVTNTGLDFRRVDMLALANRIVSPLQESVTINPIVVNLGQGDRTRGDSDFFGHGPRVNITTSVRAQGSILTVSVNALFEETESDFTTYSRSFTQDIDLSSQLPTGFVIDRIVSDLETRFSYTDTDHDVNSFNFGSDELVSRYEIQGDSNGGFFGGDDNPFVRVRFNPIRVQNL
jgi:hypothetical protein